MRLDNKVALITGATGGMGRASARLFAREGAAVVIAARNPQRGTALPDQRTLAPHAQPAQEEGRHPGALSR